MQITKEAEEVLILGGDGYLGWPTAMHFAKLGYKVTIVDNYLRRKLTSDTDSEPLFPLIHLDEKIKLFRQLTGHEIGLSIGDICDFEWLLNVFGEVKPDIIVHYAEQPSAPYSMKGYNEARLTLDNNVNGTFNVIWAMMKTCPHSHLIKLGTMGEYGTPNIDIEEGWLDVVHNGREQTFLYPRAASTLYHTTKVIDTDLLWFYVRTYDLRVTDLMQGPVYGMLTDESKLDDRLLSHFNYDDIFGTVLNRFMVQAIAGVALTVYGAGGQTRGYLNITDTLRCVEIAAKSPPNRGKLRIFNQFTETFSVSDLATKVQSAANRIGISVEIKNIDNPRKEQEDHYYNPQHTGLQKLGLIPNFLTEEVIIDVLNKIQKNRENIDERKIHPRVKWT